MAQVSLPKTIVDEIVSYLDEYHELSWKYMRYKFPIKTLYISAKCGNIHNILYLMRRKLDYVIYTRALNIASSSGHDKCVRALIPITAPKDNRNRALINACLKGNYDCVKTLIPYTYNYEDGLKYIVRFNTHNHDMCVKLLETTIRNRYHSRENKKYNFQLKGILENSLMYLYVFLCILIFLILLNK